MYEDAPEEGYGDEELTPDVADDRSHELLAFLQEEESRSRNDELLRNAETCLKSYNGDPYGDEEEGRSKVVSRDVAEVIDQMQISVLRVFVSGDRFAEIEPTDQEAEQAADDATEAIHAQFQRRGYNLLHDWFKEGNLATIGVVKACVEKKRKRVERPIPALLLEDEAMMSELGVIEADEQVEIDPETGMEMVNAAFLEEMPPEFNDYLVPLEEFRINPEARSIDDAVYVNHATPKYLSDLVEMGFDQQEVEDLQSDISSDDNGTGYARDNALTFDGADRTGALRRIILHEEYVKYDLDGDGIAEMLCVHRVGTTILRVERVEYCPFVAYCPFPMPGRFAGHSLADKVIDIQRVNTVLNRLALDGLYCNLAPGYIVPDPAVNENTYDDLLTVRPNRVIRTTGAAEIKPEEKNDVSSVAFNAMEFMIGQREARTGITRLNQGLDADALNKTATGTAMMQAQGQQMEEYLARNFAEAMSKLMRLKYQMMRQYAQPFTIRVDGEFREVDPSQWPEDIDIVIRVGLGSGRKEQRLQNRMSLLQIQAEAMGNGLSIVGEEQIYKTIAGIVKDASLGSPNDFVIDPETLKVPNPETGELEAPPKPPSPDEQKMQAEMQKMQMDQQMKAQEAQGKAEIEFMKAQMKAQAEQAANERKLEEMFQKIQLENLKAESKAQQEASRAQFEALLAQERMRFEQALALREQAFEEQIAARDSQRRDEETKLKANRPGGELHK